MVLKKRENIYIYFNEIGRLIIIERDQIIIIMSYITTTIIITTSQIKNSVRTQKYIYILSTIICMISRGLNSYQKCLELVKIIKNQKKNSISENELAKIIAINIGASKYFKTVRNYIDLLVGFKMIEKIDKDIYKINYECLNDISTTDY